MALLLLGYATEAAGQRVAPGVDVVGVVIDESGKGVADVTITATHRDTRISREVLSDRQGRFVLAGLSVGTYTVTTSRQGYWPRTLEALTVVLGERVQIEFQLSVSTVAERVDIVAEASVALVERSPGSTVITRGRIDSLPINVRNFVAFSTQAPGVGVDQTPQQGASRTSGLTFSGQRARANNIMVDGLDNNDETVGSVRALFSQEAVEEYQVISGTPSAEFGAASGGMINVITRSGSDLTTGNLFAFFRDRSLNSKAYFEKFTPSGAPIDAEKAPYHHWQYGATLGGPLRRNSSFYFLSFERADLRPSNLVNIDDQTLVTHPFNPTTVLGTPAQILRNAGFSVDTGSVPYSTVYNQFLGKLDRHSDWQSFGVRINTATELHENVEPFGGQIARSRAAALDSTDVMGAGFHTLVVSPRTLNEVRGQIAYRDQIVRSLDPSCLPCTDEQAGGPTLEVTGVASVGRQRFTPTLRDNTRYQVTDTISLFRGAHVWRAGVDASYIQGREQTLPLHFGGRYIFQPFAPMPGGPTVSAIQAVALGLPVAYVQGYGFSGAADSFGQLAAFVQDTWRIGDTATLNLGLRYQTQFWPQSSLAPAGYPGSYQFRSDRNDIAPRLAVSWQPGRSRSTTIHAGYGVYYDYTLTSIFGISKYITGASDGVRTLALQLPTSSGPWAAWAAPGHRLDEAEALELAGGSYPSVAIAVDPSLSTPYAHHTIVGVEQQLPARLAFTADVIYVRGFDQLGTIDYNPLVPSLGPGRRPADMNGVPRTSASVLQYTSFGETWYHGLRLTLNRRIANGSGLAVSYTLSKAEDNSADFQTAFLPQNNGRGRDPIDPDGLPVGFDPDDERGPSLQDQRHRLVVAGTYAAPGGIQLSTIITAGSGHPYNIVAGRDLNGDGDGGSPSPDRPRYDPADPATSIGRNAGRLPTLATVDFRVSWRWRPTSAVPFSIEPMLEVFNLFNRTNFITAQNVFGTGAYPDNPADGFGDFNQAAPPRQVQLALKVGF
jgi:hypothetical protein